jgi:pyrimidine-nucleoside phosphorylase
MKLHLPSLIERKRDGGVLSPAEIGEIIALYTSGGMPDYQMSALAMAIYFQGMTGEETGALTTAMLHSGDCLRWPEGSPRIVDKHSTGGIGDKTSLVLVPLLAAAGLWVPMISGRGLGITGGTLDKLESIPGFRIGLTEAEIYAQVAEIGCAMIGQTSSICPADKKLYALRDVTATVPSIPLITASIMSKKLAEGLDRLVLDVKHGSGAFMKTEEQAESLAQSMLAAAAAMGVDCRVMINPMSEPTGEAVGNALEVAEAVRCLQGHGPVDLESLVLDLATQLADTPRSELAAMLHNGSAWRCFQSMVEAQGGDAEALTRITDVHAAGVIYELPSPRSGMVLSVDAGTIGRVSLSLGAGRAAASDAVDFAVGCDRLVKSGSRVSAGDCLVRIHARSLADATAARHAFLEAISIA